MPCFGLQFSLNVTQVSSATSSKALKNGYSSTLTVNYTQYYYYDSTSYPGGYYTFAVGTSRLGDFNSNGNLWNTQWTAQSSIFCIPSPPSSCT